MGKIISVTIPLPLVDELQREADIVGISRSRFISNILLKWQEDKKVKESQEQSVKEQAPNNCPNRADDGFCEAFDIICSAPQKEAETCSGFTGEKI